jgi:glutathione S-transferase
VAILVYIGFVFRVGGARSKYGVKMPMTTGNLDFERVFRVHYNTLEQLPVR